MKGDVLPCSLRHTVGQVKLPLSMKLAYLIDFMFRESIKMAHWALATNHLKALPARQRVQQAEKRKGGEDAINHRVDC